MADFPSKVITETSAPNSQGSQHGRLSLRGLTAGVTSQMDVAFVRSIPAILMIAEMVLGLLQWALIASTDYTKRAAYGWVMFVAVTLWILTTVLFLLLLFGAHRKLGAIPWPLTVMMYHAVAAALYLTAFLANAASVHPFHGQAYDHMAAAAFFGAAATVAYGASAVFSYLDWRGDGGNAAASTVPT